MTIVLESEQRIRLLSGDGGLAFDAAHASLSPFHLLAASLAACTHSVLVGWATQAKLDLDGLEITVDWELGGEPYRVTGMTMELVWPELPEERRDAARRAASLCTVHHTLEHATHVETRVAQPSAR